MKYIHFPTLAMHSGLMLLALFTMNDYSDAFLGLAVVTLVCHIIWCAGSKQHLFPAHLLGSTLELAAHAYGLIAADSGAFGLGGGGFTQFFFFIALGLSIVIEGLISLIRKLK